MADIRELLEQHKAGVRALADAEQDALDELAAAKDEQRRYPDDPEAKARKKAASETVSAIREAMRADRGGVAIAGDAFLTEESS